MPELPRTIDGRNWKVLMWSSLLSGDFGFGPCGFGPTPRPRAEIQTSLRRFGVAATAVGYDATGSRPTRPNGFTPRARRPRCAAHLPARDRAMIATASSPESAESRSQPSLVTLR